MARHTLLLLLAAYHARAEYSVSQSNVYPATSTANAPAITETMTLNVDGELPPQASFSIASSHIQLRWELLDTYSNIDLWNLYVGPVSIAAINTTVQPTPIPSSSLVPPPPLYYPAFPQGAQVPVATRNESWSFPSNFSWGVASAAYQVEGAVRDEGRGPSIWDVLTHRVGDYVTDNSTGDVADNQYYLYKQDIARIAALGVPVYSFSVSWSRIFPFGRGQTNEAGLAHYDDVINTCIEYGIQPAVTLYHWDLPLYLQDTYGGWVNSQIVDDFVTYAETLFKRWGDKVPYWFTLNEPIVFCSRYPLPAGYFRETIPPIPEKQQPYFCGQNALLAHSGAYRSYKRMGLNGTISFKNNGGHKIALTSSDDDALATQRSWDFNEGWFATPVFLTGDYPATLKEYVSDFLPEFTPEQKAQILGSADVFAYDAYTAQFSMAPDDGVAGCVANSSNSLYPGCFNTSYTYQEAEGGWLIGPAADPLSPWLHKATDWVPNLMRYVTDTWKPSGGILISEFGWGEPFEYYKTLRPDILTDVGRSAYYSDYINALLISISEGANVVGCFAWSIVDNLEWMQGYTVKFGMQYVNLTTQERSYKASFFHYIDSIKAYLPAENATQS
ncbi:MAG: hypothetical protein Q9162_006924 [Coniocarpon cinnabarinum]